MSLQRLLLYLTLHLLRFSYPERWGVIRLRSQRACPTSTHQL